jgi:Family of unknown function (DUF6011)
VNSPTRVARQAVWLRQRGRAGDAERLEAALVMIGRCRRCGRGLTDPRSVRRGVGPGCWVKDPEPLLPASYGKES